MYPCRVPAGNLDNDAILKISKEKAYWDKLDQVSLFPVTRRTRRHIHCDNGRVI